MREAMGLTRQDLAEASSPEPAERVSVEMIAKVEQGRKAPSSKTLRKLAADLGVEPLAISSSAATWQAAAAAGVGLWDLRAALIGGSLGARALAPFGVAALAVAPGALPLAAVAGGFALREGHERVQWERRILEAHLARLRDVLDRGSPEDIQQEVASLDVPPQARTDV